MDKTIHARYRELRKEGLQALRAWQEANRYSDGSAYCWRLEREAARIAAWNAMHPIIKIGKTPDCFRSMAEIRRWKVDRSSGYLKIVKDKPKAPTAKQLKAALVLALPHVPPELRARLMRLAA